jgi:hypothetical protein
MLLVFCCCLCKQPSRACCNKATHHCAAVPSAQLLFLLILVLPTTSISAHRHHLLRHASYPPTHRCSKSRCRVTAMANSDILSCMLIQHLTASTIATRQRHEWRRSRARPSSIRAVQRAVVVRSSFIVDASQGASVSSGDMRARFTGSATRLPLECGRSTTSG